MDPNSGNNNLNFRGGNPGAVQYGNFINYYKFHPPEERIKLLPKNIWNHQKPCVALDIGCNAGNLTIALYDFLRGNVSQDPSVLAIDIDPQLIVRANEIETNGITFQCLDVMNEPNRERVVNDYLRTKSVEKFSVVFCFSTTMWIHLNYGDTGLQSFLKYIAGVSELLIIEPQPWKCYRTAIKRMKQVDFVFPLYSSLLIRKNVEEKIEYLLTENNLEKVGESERSGWERKLLIFRQKKKEI